MADDCISIPLWPYRNDSNKPLGAYLSETILRGGGFIRGAYFLNLNLLSSTEDNILYNFQYKILRKSVNRDGIKEGKLLGQLLASNINSNKQINS